MKRPSLLALTIIIMALALVACERPAPTGDVPTPAPSDSTFEVVPAVTPDTTTPIEPAPETETADPTEPAAEGEVTTEEGENTTETSPETEAPTEETTVTEEPTEAAPPLEDGVYVVKSGDTLGQIAFIFDVSVEDIMAANGLTNPDVLDVGDELIIPDAGFAETAVDPDNDDDGGVTTSERIHVVQAGDNLFRIGQFYGFTVDELAEYNDITDINNLDIGQEIKIPPSNQ